MISLSLEPLFLLSVRTNTEITRLYRCSLHVALPGKQSIVSARLMSASLISGVLMTTERASTRVINSGMCKKLVKSANLLKSDGDLLAAVNALI